MPTGYLKGRSGGFRHTRNGNNPRRRDYKNSPEMYVFHRPEHHDWIVIADTGDPQNVFMREIRADVQGYRLLSTKGWSLVSRAWVTDINPSMLNVKVANSDTLHHLRRFVLQQHLLHTEGGGNL